MALTNQIQRQANVLSQRHTDVKFWYLVVRYGNQNPTSCRRHNGNVNTTSNSNIIWLWSLVSRQANVLSQRHTDVKFDI